MGKSPMVNIGTGGETISAGQKLGGELLKMAWKCVVFNAYHVNMFLKLRFKGTLPR